MFWFLLLLAGAAWSEPSHTLTIYHTNDLQGQLLPGTYFDESNLGGFARLSHLLKEARTDSAALVLDGGDALGPDPLSHFDQGRLAWDLMREAGYTAMVVGNHEFDYGLDGAEAYMRGEPFPVLSANLFYKGTERLYAKPYAIVERNGIKIGVIGIFGVDAVPSTNIHTWDTLEARDPVPILRRLVPQLRKQVDLVVVLAHQGETGPMQSDAEAHPEVQRNFDADKATVAAVPGIDVFVGGHAHRGIEVPWVSPQTGSIVVQTYGQIGRAHV